MVAPRVLQNVGPTNKLQDSRGLPATASQLLRRSPEISASWASGLTTVFAACAARPVTSKHFSLRFWPSASYSKVGQSRGSSVFSFG